MYLMVCTRLDSSHVVGMMSGFLSNPGKVVKSFCRYLRDSPSMCFSVLGELDSLGRIYKCIYP